MFFKNELNRALKRISELETEIKSLKEDSVSKKEFSKLQFRLSKMEETIKTLSENKSQVTTEANTDNTMATVQPAEDMKDAIKKNKSIKTNESEPEKAISVKDFVAKNKKSDCSIFKYADYKDGIEITQYIGLNRTRVDIPDYIDGKPVIRIGDQAFEGAKEIENIYFSDTLKEIGINAFAFSGIRNFNTNSDIELIDKGAFFACENLLTVTIPANVTEIKASTFACCEKINNVKFSSKLKTIEQKAFVSCKALKVVNLPSSLERIEEQAFFDTMIYRIVFPQNVKFVGANVTPNSTKHIAFLSADTDIKDSFVFAEATYCIPGGKTYECLRKQRRTIKSLEEFPE